MDEAEDKIALVVMESGAPWPAWMSEYRRVIPNSVVESQLDNETPAAFATRVAERLTHLHATRTNVRVGVLCVSNQSSDAIVDARCRIARCVLRGMTDLGFGELVIAAPDLQPPGAPGASGSDERRHQLFALAGTLCEELKGSDVSVSVRFGSGAIQSGTMPSIASAAAGAWKVAVSDA